MMLMLNKKIQIFIFLLGIFIFPKYLFAGNANIACLTSNESGITSGFTGTGDFMYGQGGSNGNIDCTLNSQEYYSTDLVVASDRASMYFISPYGLDYYIYDQYGSLVYSETGVASVNQIFNTDIGYTDGFFYLFVTDFSKYRSYPIYMKDGLIYFDIKDFPDTIDNVSTIPQNLESALNVFIVLAFAFLFFGVFTGVIYLLKMYTKK